MSARITLGPALVSSITLVAVGVCHGANWYDAPVSKNVFSQYQQGTFELRTKLPAAIGASAWDGRCRVHHLSGEIHMTWGNRGFGEQGRWIGGCQPPPLSVSKPTTPLEGGSHFRPIRPAIPPVSRTSSQSRAKMAIRSCGDSIPFPRWPSKVFRAARTSSRCFSVGSAQSGTRWRRAQHI